MRGSVMVAASAAVIAPMGAGRRPNARLRDVCRFDREGWRL